MKNYYKSYIQHYEMPLEQRERLLTLGENIMANPLFFSILNDYESNGYDIKATEEKRAILANELSLSIYSINFVLLVCATKKAKEKYHVAGISEDIFYDTMGDLLRKLNECQQIYKVDGIFVEWWYPIFMNLKVFKLGRLEYEICPNYLTEDVTVEGETIKTTDEIITVHIPSGEDFSKSAREDSYRKAYAFFKDRRTKNGNLILLCESWLIYKGNYDILNGKGNIADFQKDFHLIKNEELDTFHDAWRVFNKVGIGHNFEDLPEDTSVQRAFKSWLLAGKKTGIGFGVRIQKE